MVKVCPETMDFFYHEQPSAPGYTAASRPQLEAVLVSQGISQSASEGVAEKIAAYCHGLASVTDGPLLFGGTEEEICERGTDWCTDLARVACVLMQIAGVMSRIVALADPSRAYTRHSVVEAWRDGSWGVFDPVWGKVYRANSGAPLSTWQLMTDPAAIRANLDPEDDVAHWIGQFSAAAISEYSVAHAARYDYTVGKLNRYYRSILASSSKGWPGGLRWVHGEDAQ